MHNRLAAQSSPYLRQHADNPVAWQPWDQQALTQAREQDKPILLSIGYSACHWCHVMAHESFEDEQTAALMNAGYVNIKVDREERPDLDKVYQLAYQIMRQRGGGWPLTMLLDPHTHTPFMAGTYFPKTASRGMPAFADVLRQAANWYHQNKDKLEQQSQQLDAVFARLEPQPATPAEAEALAHAAEQLQAEFDAEHGGFGGAPKFPQPGTLEFLTTLASAGDGVAAEMAAFSLHCMCAGGLFDHLGGGFFRYAVDAQWTIPHFEKMLYDNGSLLALTSAQAAADPLCNKAAHATADWLIHDMQAPEGGFYASLDADSIDGEGAYYFWDKDAIERVLGDRYPAFAAGYGLAQPANFASRWHLQWGTHQQPQTETIDALEQSRQQLLHERRHRTAPGRDEKILTAWNALAISGLISAHHHLGRADCLRAAERALTFIRRNLWRQGRLLASCKDGKASLPAYLDDHAFLLTALLDMLAERWHTPYLRWAQDLSELLLQHFEDSDNGGFYFTADDHEVLIHRPKPLVDESTPSGNGVAARALLQLGWLVGEPRYLAAAEHTLLYAGTLLRRYPLGHATLLTALHDYLHPPELVVLRGTGETLQRWQQAASTDGRRLVFSIPTTAPDLPAALAEKKPQGQAVAYLCQGMTCSAPITRFQELNNRDS